MVLEWSKNDEKIRGRPKFVIIGYRIEGTRVTFLDHLQLFHFPCTIFIYKLYITQNLFYNHVIWGKLNQFI